uniref:Uncharacterized protein n=1 Tax=Ovis aries TaxID=9940 RepID=A0AC11CZ27_SHEEP
MSHSQFHCTGRAYLDMHGLIFETSICYWQDQPVIQVGEERATKGTITDLMSHSQFHCTGRAYLDMHGLIFETSICYWQDQPALRANPYPEVTDPACRLPLPTLFQHARGCSPWRPAADMGTARREIYTLSPRIFKGQRELTGRRRNRDAFQGAGPSLGANPFQGALPFTKKRELSPGLPPASPGSVALPHWTPRGARLRHSGFGDLNPTPFRSAEGNGGHRPSLRNGARPSLRTD